MSEETPTPNHARPIRRFSIGLLSLLQIIFILLIFLGVNFLSSQHHRPYDLSEDLGFTLAPSTARYLQSSAVQSREVPVRMIVAFRADSPFYERIRPIAEEFTRISGGKVELQLIDPIRANDLAESVAAEYNLVFNQDIVIIDARSSRESPAVNGEKKVSPNVHIARLEDMVVYETDANNQRRVRGFLGEDSLRSGLVNAIEGKPRKVLVFSDKSDLTSEKSEGIWQVFSANLVSQNIVPERVRLADLEKIPDDVEAVAIVAANSDLTPEELAVMEEYWRRPRAAILVTTGDADCPPRLRAFLRTNGVTPRPDRVLTVDSGVVQTSVAANFTQGLEFMRDLWEKPTLLEGVTHSLDVREGAEDLLNQRIAPYSLLESDKKYWGERNFGNEIPDFDKNGEAAGPLPLAAAVVRGAATDDRFAGETSRMVLIGNSAFLSPQHVRQSNLDFLASSANWLIGREDLTGKGPKNLRIYKLPILPPHVTFINRFNLLVLPAVLLLIGALVWSSRRA
ncbi:MAG: GldG family protein [Akkermansiaceae bacterium]|jgi:hypothetical protein|nr:GldG family protein [Akkermansiaceae bacterium]